VGAHGATPVTFCHLCQLVLCGGTPLQNAAQVLQLQGLQNVLHEAKGDSLNGNLTGKIDKAVKLPIG
jgi:hypothetical protein